MAFSLVSGPVDRQTFPEPATIHILNKAQQGRGKRLRGA